MRPGLPQRHALAHNAPSIPIQNGGQYTVSKSVLRRSRMMTHRLFLQRKKRKKNIDTNKGQVIKESEM